MKKLQKFGLKLSGMNDYSGSSTNFAGLYGEILTKTKLQKLGISLSGVADMHD